MEQKEITNLRKNYPEENYNIKEQQGKLTIVEKKAILWVPIKYNMFLPSGVKELSDFLEALINTTSFEVDSFKFGQKVVSKKCWKLLGEKAKELNTTRKAFLLNLLKKNFTEK